MADTPYGVRSLANNLRYIVASDRDFIVTMAKAEYALERYATLLEQVAAHEKVCAGKWVNVEDRLPERLWEGQVITESGVLLQGFSFRDGDFGFLRGSQFIKALSRVALWLDARKPGEER